MNLNSKFWVLMTIFQVAFGLAVFAATRQYYIQDAKKTAAHTMVTEQAAAAWPKHDKDTGLEQLISTTSARPISRDPAETLLQADELFSNRQYDQAAVLYERLIVAGSGDANIYNNLGLTLHYLGRSGEALKVLNEGVAVDSSYQRIWLTLGFVNSQLGHFEQARKALTTALQMDANNDVGQSAQQMLEALPQSGN
jgi:Flp pilus assembly protein TadD